MHKKEFEFKNKMLNAKGIGTALLVLFILLLFASKTIYSYNLPEVTAVQPVNDKLSKRETAKGVVSWADLISVYAEKGGSVAEIFVKEGDFVAQGAPLMRLTLTKEEVANRANQSIELQGIDRDIQNAEKDHAKLEILYGEGAISKSELDSSERNLQSLYDKKQKAALDYQATAVTGDGLTIYAQEDSVINEISAHKGQKISDGQLVVTCGTSSEYEIAFMVSADNNFIAPGDSCSLENTSHTLEGIVSKITPKDQGKEILVTALSENIMVGETFEATFEKKSAESHILVPNGSLNMDSDGYYLYQIKQRKGLLGKEFYVERLSIYIGDSDDSNTIVSKGVTFFEPIVLYSDKSLSDGQTVKLNNEGDFFVE